ncbi:zf-HC2 domain-containing protein [Glutamicibacter sp.]|uniref:anti-sigma factor family protein n=1 Tax=Glutamicibacter sp. TaxID=1931995 RepID=UPI0028BD4BF6|nr:zf-HC2 domain-containing protein [Glutamicibacter sp.]
MNEHESLCEWDAAYMLGALNSADKLRFEAHLKTCQDCQSSLAGLSTVPPMLARIAPPDDLLATPAASTSAPPTGNAAAPEAVKKPAKRRLYFALAAVMLLAAGVGLGSLMNTAPAAPPVVQTLALTPATSQDMAVKVGFEPKKWGTALTINCDYPPATDYSGSNTQQSYVLVVQDREGVQSKSASWKYVAGQKVTVPAATSMRMDDIAVVSVQLADGTTVFSAPLEQIPKNS